MDELQSCSVGTKNEMLSLHEWSRQHLGWRSDPGGARTLDPLIKSQLLYQLSYRVILYFPCW